MLEDLAKVNALSELGGDAGAFIAGANAFGFSARLLNEVGMAEANRRRNAILPDLMNDGMIKGLGPGRSNIPFDLRLNPWDVRGKVRGAINKSYFHPPTIGKGILEARRASLHTNQAFRSISKFNSFNRGAYIFSFEVSKGLIFKRSLNEIAKFSNSSPYVRIIVFSASSYSFFKLVNFYLSLCKFTYKYSLNQEYRFSVNSKISVFKKFISNNALKTYDFILINIYLCSHQDDLEQIYII
jgi:hypothetical protein